MFVSCTLSDGLGNRLFQIAAMLGYAERHGHTPVFIKEYIRHNETQPGGNSVCSLFPGIQTLSLESAGGVWTVLKPPFEFAMTYVDLQCVSGNVRLDGYFQSERYFPTRVQTTLVSAPAPEPTLFLHVRRGDYLHPLNQHHYVDLTEYYQRALDMFPPDARILVVSDDSAWCKAVLPARYRSVDCSRWVWLEHANEYTTLSAMMGCSLGGICANSTFSWWGAYFQIQQNHSPERLITMPSRWAHGGPGRPQATDIYPRWAVSIDLA